MSHERLRIVLHDHGGYPFAAQLARELATRGHHVLYLHAGGMREPRVAFETRKDEPPSFQMDGVGLRERLHRRAGPGRLLQERRYARALANRIRLFQPDIVLSGTGPLDAHSSAQRSAHAMGAAFVFWLQDVYSIAIDQFVGRRIPVVGRAISIPFALLERRLLHRSDAIVATSADFLPILHRWRIDAERISVVENWAPLDEVHPLPRRNRWAERNGLLASSVLLYAGTLGRKHDPRLLLALADELPDAVVVVVSDGVGTDLLRTIGQGRTNLILLPLQPAAEVAQMLATADVLVALLEHRAHLFSVPSKVLTYLAAGRPILAAMPAANLAARTIKLARAGMVVEPSDRVGFVAAARELLNDPDARVTAGQGARAYAEQAFDIGAITDEFERVFTRARGAVRLKSAHGRTSTMRPPAAPPEAGL